MYSDVKRGKGGFEHEIEEKLKPLSTVLLMTFSPRYRQKHLAKRILSRNHQIALRNVCFVQMRIWGSRSLIRAVA